MQHKGIASATFRKKMSFCYSAPHSRLPFTIYPRSFAFHPLHLPWWELSIDIFDDYALPLSRQQTERFSPFFCFPFIYFLFMFWIIFHYFLARTVASSFSASSFRQRRRQSLESSGTRIRALRIKSLISSRTIHHKRYDNSAEGEWSYLDKRDVQLQTILLYCWLAAWYHKTFISHQNWFALSFSLLSSPLCHHIYTLGVLYLIRWSSFAFYYFSGRRRNCTAKNRRRRSWHH